MKHHYFCIILFILFMFSSYADDSIAKPVQNEAPHKPNIIWIVLDACRASSLTPYGYGRPTSPHIQQIADRGIVFENHFAQASKTMWSVPSYMTGRYFPIPCFSNFFSGTVLQRMPPAGEELISKTLGAHGYKTAIFSNMPLFFETDRLAKSFDDVFLWGVGKNILLQRWADTMSTPLRQWLEGHRNEPFFLYIHAADTHFPHEMVPPYDQWIDPTYDQSNVVSFEWGQDYIPMDGKEFTEDDKAFFLDYYDGMVFDADSQIGLLIDALGYFNLIDSTIFIISSDHGQLLGEDGQTVDHIGETDEVLHIPLIICGPGIPVGKRVTALTENVDVVPTLIELLSIETPAVYHGHSLISLFQNRSPENWRTHVFSVPDRMTYERPYNFAIITKDVKYRKICHSNDQALWRMPDSAGKRKNLLDEDRVLANKLNSMLQNTWLPLYDEFQSLPVDTIIFESLWLVFNTDDKDAISIFSKEELSKESTEDGSEKTWFYSGGFLAVRNDKGAVHSLSYVATIPNGEYRMLANMFNATNYEGLPASSLHIHIHGESELRRVAQATQQDIENAITTADLGIIRINNETIEFSLHGGALGYWTCIHSICLVPLDRDNTKEIHFDRNLLRKSPSTSDEMETHEIMRGLGYL